MCVWMCNVAFWIVRHPQQDVLKEGRVDYNFGSAKKPKWAQRMLSLNEVWLVCHELQAVSIAELNDQVVSLSSHECYHFTYNLEAG